MTDRSYGGREAPFSLRLTFEERAKLERSAGSMPVSAYIKSLLFAEDAPNYRSRRKAPEADEKLLAEVLACVGASRIANNLNQLAKAANTGTLYFDADTKADIKRACDDINAMRHLLMRALGVAEERVVSVKESPSQAFTRAAAPPRSQAKRFTP